MPRQRRKVPWLTQRDEAYYVYWYDDETNRTKRISLGTSDSMEAQQRYAAFLGQGHAILGPSATTGLTVKQALDDYYKEHVAINCVQKGAKRTEDGMVHLNTWFKNTLIRDIDIPASRGYVNARRKGVVGGGKRRPDRRGSDGTIRRELATLVAAANHARKWKRLAATDMPTVELPHHAPPREEWLTKQELALAIMEAPTMLRDFILLAYYTAARRGSIERLTRDQVDLAHGRINLTSPQETANERRSKKRRPIVPIFPEIRPVVKRLMEANSSSVWLFGAAREMYHPFRDHMLALGLAKKAHPHVLRHSRATHLLQDGKGLWDVAKLLGDSATTVERVYGGHCPDHLANL